MTNPSTLSAIDILRNTLLDIEMILEFRREDPALHELERHVVQAVAEPEAKRKETASLSSGDLLPIR
jgi:hypothetical protein